MCKRVLDAVLRVVAPDHAACGLPLDRQPVESGHLRGGDLPQHLVCRIEDGAPRSQISQRIADRVGDRRAGPQQLGQRYEEQILAVAHQQPARKRQGRRGPGDRFGLGAQGKTAPNPFLHNLGVQRVKG